MLDIQSIRDTIGKTYTRPNPKSVALYEVELKANELALKYLNETRGLTDETISNFHLGYRKDYNAISIPIFKEDELVNIKYRFINPTASRYSGEGNAETWLFNEEGLSVAKETGRLLIVEGEIDAMSVWQAGVRNVISPASGKDSYGVWLERLDNIPKVYIAYDNDVGGNETAKELATRIGIDKSYNVKYPKGTKDANEFLTNHTGEDIKKLLNESKPYYSYEYRGLGDIIESLRSSKNDELKIPFIPKVEIEKDWLVIISGKTNAGKTSFVMNIASWLAEQNIPTLIMPFERGIESVGKRFLQIKFNKTIQEFKETTPEEWDTIIEKTVDAPIYFSMPKNTEIVHTIEKARRLFGTRVVIIDHLDYIIRNAHGSKEAEISRTLQELKRTAEDNQVIMLIVTHVRKIDDAGSLLKKRAGIEDLKGSSSVYQDPECVVMLNGENEMLHVEIVKNKGEMSSQDFDFNIATGKLTDSWGQFADL